MKMRNVVTIFLALTLALATVPAMAGDETNDEPFNIGEYLAEIGLNFSFIGEMNYPLNPEIRCQCWQREYGIPGRIWIQIHNCNFEHLSKCIEQNRTFFFPWEKEEEPSYYTTSDLEEKYKIEIQVRMVENGEYIITYNGIDISYMQSGDNISMIPQDAVLEINGNNMLLNKFVTYIVTGGKY